MEGVHSGITRDQQQSVPIPGHRTEICHTFGADSEALGEFSLEKIWSESLVWITGKPPHMSE